MMNVVENLEAEIKDRKHVLNHMETFKDPYSTALAFARFNILELERKLHDEILKEMNT